MDTTKKIPVSKDGLERLKEELHHLSEVRRLELTAAVAEARSHGDLRENAAYDAARQDQAMNERRIQEIEVLLQKAVIIDENQASTGFVRIGSTVKVQFGDDKTDTDAYTIVGAIEASPTNGRISNESPIGKALVGRRAGETTYFMSPGGQQKITVLEVS